MGNEEHEGQLLRKVNVHSSGISAVSESVNISGFRLDEIQSTNPDLTVAPPVMKKLDHLTAVQAQAPTEADLTQAYNEVGLKMSSLSSKREKAVAKSGRLHAKQTQLQTLQGGQYAKPNVRIDFNLFRGINPEAFMFENEKGSPEEKYLNHYAQLQGFFLLLPDLQAFLDSFQKPLTQDIQGAYNEAEVKLKTLYDIQAFYKTKEALMSNKYYAYLPQEEMEKLSYRELRLRLDKLYNDAPRNEDLIDFYQNQIRLKEVGLSDAKSVKSRQKEYSKAAADTGPKEDKRKGTDVIKKMAGTYEKLLKKAGDSKCLTNVDAYKEVFFRNNADDLEKFRASVTRPSGAVQTLFADYDTYKTARAQQQALHEDRTQTLLKAHKPKNKTVMETGNDPTAGISLNDDQKSAVRLIGNYLLQNTDGHDAFVYNLVQMPLDVQLLAFYITEKGTQESVVGVDYLSAMSNYQPDLEAFKKKKDWNAISAAVRTSMGLSQEVKLYNTVVQQAKQTEDLREDPNAMMAPEELADSLTQSIIQHGMILKMLYRSAGLHDDMPPDMAQDPVVRKKLFDEYKKLIALVGRLAAVDLPDPVQDITDADYADPQMKDKKKVRKERDTSITQKDVQGSISKTNQYAVGYVFGGLKNLAGSFMSAIPGNVAGGISFVTSNGIGGATAIFGLVAAISNTVALYQSRDNITQADGFARMVSNLGDYTKVVSGGLAVAGSVTNLIQTGTVASTEWLKASSKALWNSTAVGGKLVMWGGITAMVAGTIKMGAAGVQLGRAVSNAWDAHEAGVTIADKKRNGTPLSDDEEQLELLLSHRQRTIGREAASATMGMVSGAMSVIAGGFAMSGYLAPIGAIVGLAALGIDLIYKGIDYGVKKRNQKKAVDEFINLDNLVTQVKGDATHPLAAKIGRMKDGVLRDNIREEALAMLGYTSYEQCFRDRCVDMAQFLYFKVFLEQPKDANVADYRNAMSSFGFEIKEPVAGETGKPSVEAMITKLMS